MIPLHPMNLNKIFKKTLLTLKKNYAWTTIFWILISLPVLLYFPEIFGLEKKTSFDIFFEEVGIWKTIILITSGLFFMYFQALVICFTSNEYKLEKLTVKQVLRKSLVKYWNMLKLYLSTSVAVFIICWMFGTVGIIAIVTGGMLLSARITCIFPVMLIEKLSPMKAIFRSSELASGNDLRIIGYIIYIRIFSELFGLLPLIATRFYANTAVIDLVSSFLLNGFLQALPLVFSTHLYYDLRAREEKKRHEKPQAPKLDITNNQQEGVQLETFDEKLQ